MHFSVVLDTSCLFCIGVGAFGLVRALAGMLAPSTARVAAAAPMHITSLAGRPIF